MLDIKYIRENKERVKENCKNRLSNCNIDKLLEVDELKKKINLELEELRAEKNKVSKNKPTAEEIQEMKKLGEKIKELEGKLNPLEEEFYKLLMEVPNLTHQKVKKSNDENEVVVLEECREKIGKDFAVKDHVKIAEDLDLIDFDRATKVSGAKFYYLKNEAAFLEIALIQYALEIAQKNGYTPFITPDLAKREILEGLGFSPRGESTQIYNIDESDLSLIGTSEITMGGYHMNETFSEEDLPKKYVAVSHCFRTEAGSYSKFSKGIFRVHQFTKIELFQYVLPHQSEGAHKEILEVEKEIFEGLGIPFQVVDHTTADLGAPSYRTYDLEAYLPGKPNKKNGIGDWAEITSTSNCTDYQSRALNIKFKNKEGKKEFVHTLNGTAIAIPRAIIAILENFQTKDGKVEIPQVLHKYLPFKEIKLK